MKEVPKDTLEPFYFHEEMHKSVTWPETRWKGSWKGYECTLLIQAPLIKVDLTIIKSKY